MKFCQGKIVELDPKKWYWLVVRQDAEVNLENIQRQDGQIIIIDELDSIEFVENPDRIKGIIVKEF